MRLGDLRHLLRLESPTAGTPDGHGQPPAGWEPEGDVYASIEPLSGRELELARQVEARVTHQVTIRYREGVSPQWRLVKAETDRERYFQIASVRNEDERDDVMILLAQEVAA